MSMKIMRIDILVVVILVLVLLGCGDKDDAVSTAIPIYNHAYQENYQPDSLEEILLNAKDAYVLVDPFEKNTSDYIEIIKEKNNQVGGYISVGTGEDWRFDFSELEPYLSDKVWSDWEGEYFVSETTTGIVDIMKKRIDNMSTWGLDWVEFDNMDWLDENSRVRYSLTATVEESKKYINTLCDYVHEKGMKCMAKNTVNGFEHFDGVLYESTSSNKNWWEQEETKLFLKKGKLVIINHYNETDCDGAYREYQNDYKSKNISFICEDVDLEKYKHYNEEEVL